MRFPSITEFKDKATAAFKRFPVTLTWAVLGSCAIIGLLNSADDTLFDKYSNLILTLILGISWLIGTQFFTEQFKKPVKLWWTKVITIGFLVVIYMYLPTEVRDKQTVIPYTRYALYLIAGHIFALCAPFFMSWNAGAYYNYLKNVIVAVARSVLFSGVLYLGLVLAMLAVQFLFEVDFDGVRYVQLFVFCLGIVNTWVYLADFPKNIQFNLRFNYVKATSVFVKFILIPLAALYIVILYAYAIKILLRWELPEGWVSYLILALSALILLIQFMVHPVRHTHDSRIIRRFTPFCYWLLLPLLPLLYTAIYRRVTDYGITENRYFLIVLAGFITVSAIYLLLSRKKQLRFLPISLLALILISSVEPWGAFSVSIKSQLNQMKEIADAFAKAKKEQNMSTEDSVSITQEQFYRFRSITRYLYQRERLAESQKFLGYDPVKKFGKANRYSIGDSIIKKMGVKVQYDDDYRNAYRNYYIDQAQPIAIAGFDLMKEIDIQGSRKKSIPITSGYELNYDSEYNALTLQKDGESRISINLNSLAKKLNNRTGDEYAPVENSEMTLDTENEFIKVRVVFKTISFEKEDENGDEKPKLRSANLILLLKTKNDAE